MSSSPHLRGIVLAGALAALALALGFVTLAMNQTASHATPHTIVPLKDRHHSSTVAAKAPAKTPAEKPAAPVKKVPKVDPNFLAATKAGLPASIGHALAKAPVAIVELTSSQDPVAKLSATEASDGAASAGAAYVGVDVDRNGGDAGTLTRLLGTLPTAPATLVYVRPAQLYVTLPGFNDRTAVEQAAASAALTVGASLALSPDWSQKADTLCRQVNAKLSGMGGVTDAKGLAAQKAEFESVATRFLADFKALKAPAGQEAQVAHLNTLLAQNFSALDAMVAAATLKDPQAEAAALLRAVKIGPELNSLERQLGATGCAELAP